MKKYEYKEGRTAAMEFEDAMKIIFKAPKQTIKKGARTQAPSKGQSLVDGGRND